MFGDITTSELRELRRSQVVYIEWCTRRIQETGNLEPYMVKVEMAARMTTRIDIALSEREYLNGPDL